MKHCSIIFLLSILLLLNHKSDAQQQPYYEFLKYVNRRLDPPKSVKEACEWQPAIVQVQTDKQNRIISYKLLNNVTDALANSFAFLNGYQFPSAIPIKSRPIVFCISIENKKMECMATLHYSPEDVLGKLFGYFEAQAEARPQTIFLYRVLIISYAHDSIK